MCWWGIWILRLSPSTDGTLSWSIKSAQYGAIVSPILTVLCVALLLLCSRKFVMSDVNRKTSYVCIWRSYGREASSFQTLSTCKWAERVGRTCSRIPNYQAYLQSTSILIPLPPALYCPLPVWLKRSVLLDFPVYQFHEGTDRKAALEEERRRLGLVGENA